MIKKHSILIRKPIVGKARRAYDKYKKYRRMRSGKKK